MESQEDLYKDGRTAMARGDFEAALIKLRAAADIYPHFKTFESVGECLLALERLNSAVLYFSAAAGLGNRQARYYFLLAVTLEKMGRVDDAKEKLESALNLNQNYKAARELLNRINGS